MFFQDLINLVVVVIVFRQPDFTNEGVVLNVRSTVGFMADIQTCGRNIGTRQGVLVHLLLQPQLR